MHASQIDCARIQPAMTPPSADHGDVPLDDQPSRAIARKARAAKRQAVTGEIEGGDDFDPEGPTQADIERFNSPTVRCRNCKRDVFDDTVACPHCGELIDTIEEKHMPVWAMVTLAVVVLGFALLFVL